MKRIGGVVVDGGGGHAGPLERGAIWMRTANSYLPAEAVCDTVTASPDFLGRHHQTAQWGRVVICLFTPGAVSDI